MTDKPYHIRDDLSSKLIHFTKGSDEEASEVFLKIIHEGRLLSGSGYIKGGYRCVCFTEAPVGKIAHILANREMYGVNYAPFGIMVDKLWLWKKGGRPVIYQSDAEYELLDEEQRYRHKRYEPDQGIDFTWEREWRIKTPELLLEPQENTLVVPSRTWVNWLVGQHFEMMRGDALALGKNAYLFMEKYPWHFIALEDLGMAGW